MVLLHDIVEILAGAHPGTAPSRMFAPKQPQSAVSRPVRIKCDDPRRPIVAKRLAKELLRCLDVAMLAQAKVDRPAALVDSAVQVDPFATDFEWSERPGVVELSPGLSSPNRTCTSQRIRLSIQVLLKAKAMSA
jgi:hypothetical protein